MRLGEELPPDDECELLVSGLPKGSSHQHNYASYFISTCCGVVRTSLESVTCLTDRIAVSTQLRTQPRPQPASWALKPKMSPAGSTFEIKGKVPLRYQRQLALVRAKSELACMGVLQGPTGSAVGFAPILWRSLTDS